MDILWRCSASPHCDRYARPDTAVTIRTTLIGGRSGGELKALRIASGQTIWAVATSIGIVTLLVASEPLFLTVKYAGAAYLAFLGAQGLREAVRPAVSSAQLGERLGQKRIEPIANDVDDHPL